MIRAKSQQINKTLDTLEYKHIEKYRTLDEHGKEVTDYILNMVGKNELTKRALFGIPVGGDSMEPTYHDGDILIVERADMLEMGEIGIFTLDGEGYNNMVMGN